MPKRNELSNRKSPISLNVAEGIEDHSTRLEMPSLSRSPQMIGPVVLTLQKAASILTPAPGELNGVRTWAQ